MSFFMLSILLQFSHTFKYIKGYFIPAENQISHNFKDYNFECKKIINYPIWYTFEP